MVHENMVKGTIDLIFPHFRFDDTEQVQIHLNHDFDLEQVQQFGCRSVAIRVDVAVGDDMDCKLAKPFDGHCEQLMDVLLGPFLY